MTLVRNGERIRRQIARR